MSSQSFSRGGRVIKLPAESHPIPPRHLVSQDCSRHSLLCELFILQSSQYNNHAQSSIYVPVFLASRITVMQDRHGRLCATRDSTSSASSCQPTGRLVPGRPIIIRYNPIPVRCLLTPPRRLLQQQAPPPPSVPSHQDSYSAADLSDYPSRPNLAPYSRPSAAVVARTQNRH